MAGIRDTLSYLFGMGGNPDAKNLSPEDQEQSDVQKWALALEDAKKFVEPWHTQAKRAVSAFLDDRSDSENSRSSQTYRLNLFNSNVKTLTATLYAKLPKVEADRRFLDPNDAVARVAGEMITRLLQNDMNDPDDTLKNTLKNSLEDRLVPGLGCARVKYDIEEREAAEQPPAPEPQIDPTTGQPAEAEPAEPVMEKADEWTDVVYTHWRDVLWSPCRTEGELTWKAFRSYFSKAKATKRFGKEVATGLSYSQKPAKTAAEKATEIKTNDPQAEVWEIWDNETKCVYWFSKGYDKWLDKQDDPLELDGFYPDGNWMVANTSTTKYLPKPDYTMAHTLYEEIDELESRIALLTAACKVVGVYDRQSKDIQRMLSEGVENQLIPVDNWAMFAERGGLKGMTDWLPLEQVVNAVNILSQQQAGRIQQLYQVTGMSDIMRGQASQSGTTATEQRIKAQYGSVRIQAVQDEFAQFAESLLNKKVQIIQKYYDPQRIMELSNIANTPDAQLAQQAVALIKNPDQFNIRIAIRAESMAQVDYDQRAQERSAYLQAVAQFFGQSEGILEQKPEMAPFMIQMLKFSLAGLKGSSEMEGIFDQMIAQMQAAEQAKAQQPPQPSPEQVKAQADAQAQQQEMALEQQKAAAEQQAAAADAQAKQRAAVLDIQQRQQEMAQSQEKFQNEQRARQEEHAMKMSEMILSFKQQTELNDQKLEAAKAQAARKESGDAA